MHSAHRSSKGKSRAGEGDYAQSFASLSLSDYGDHVAPRTDSYESSYPDVYGSSYEQQYAGDSHYGWAAQNSLAPAQSSSAAYSGTSSYSSSYPTTSASSSTGGYGYPSESSVNSDYGAYPGYDTASVTSSSSYGGGSVAGWSDAQSLGTAPSSAPSTHSNRTDVNNTINRQGPPNERYQLPCEFHNLTGCDRVFTGDDAQGWMDHVERHLQSKFPTRLRCWFCSDHRFDAREMSGGDVRSNFITRMEHIRDHFVYDGFRREQMIKDGYLVQHLLDRNIIDRRTYDSILNPTTLPAIPGGQGGQGRHSSHRSQHGHHGHRRLPQVEEEVVAESSSRQHHRSDHKREGHREHGSSSHRHKHRK